ncbi:MAG: PD40 domain-containing protein [Actinobacteria bacterium]|nr:PD40 domain-containing protein [Actinomycetota bacterium]
MTARPMLVASVAAILAAVAALTVVGSPMDAAVGAAPLPSGPRLVVGVMRVGAEVDTELLSIGPAGEDPQVLAHGNGNPGEPSFEHPNWNLDGTELAFFGPGRGSNAVFRGDADGGHLRLLADSERLGGRASAPLPEPLFDPRTGAVVVAALHVAKGRHRPRIREEFWVLPSDGGRPHRLSSAPVTRRHPSVVYPYSTAPSGMIVATRRDPRGRGIVMVDPRTSAARTVVAMTTQREGSLDPAISPDGKEIVFEVDTVRRGRHNKPGSVSSTDLMIVPATGGKPKLLARVEGGASWPSWDPSGSRIAFTALNVGQALSFGPQVGNSVMEINADGTCLTQVYSPGRAGAVQGAAWEPGPGRGAGPISC